MKWLATQNAPPTNTKAPNKVIQKSSEVQRCQWSRDMRRFAMRAKALGEAEPASYRAEDTQRQHRAKA